MYLGSKELPFIDTQNSNDVHLDCVKTEPVDSETEEQYDVFTDVEYITIKEEAGEDTNEAAAAAAANNAGTSLLRARPISTLTKDADVSSSTAAAATTTAAAVVGTNGTARNSSVVGFKDIQPGTKLDLSKSQILRTPNGKIIILSGQKNSVFTSKSPTKATPTTSTTAMTTTNMLQKNPTKIYLTNSSNSSGSFEIKTITSSSATSPTTVTKTTNLTVVKAGDVTTSTTAASKATVNTTTSSSVVKSAIASPVVIKRGTAPAAASNGLSGRAIIAGGGLKLVSGKSQQESNLQDKQTAKLKLKFTYQSG